MRQHGRQVDQPGILIDRGSLHGRNLVPAEALAHQIKATREWSIAKRRSFVRKGERIVPMSDFSGFVSSACALASAAAIAPIDSLERWMRGLLVEKVKAHRPRARALGPDPMPDRLLGILRHQAFELGLGILMFRKTARVSGCRLRIVFLSRAAAVDGDHPWKTNCV
jgi:hypothetical protein